MGLYFALQESVFFRLEPATPWWIVNLAAPDMLLLVDREHPVDQHPGEPGRDALPGPVLQPAAADRGRR